MTVGPGESLPMTSGWRVTSDVEVTAQADNGQFAQGHKISFTTGNGGQGSVFVPDSSYNVATVRRLIAAKVAIMDQVAALTHEGS